jgi:hypothetical protein
MARVKKRDYEKLTSSNIEKVIELLNGDTPISKKDACEILNISYNTTRLNKIIEDHLDRKKYVKERKAKNRGKAASDSEIGEAVTGFLTGESIADIASRLYRSPAFVKGIIERVGVPQPTKEGINYLPDECTADSFEEGEIVWSARYDKPAIVEKEISVNYQAEKPGYSDVNYETKYGSKCYSIFVMEPEGDDSDAVVRSGKAGYYAYSLAYDLGKLEHLQKYKVNLSRI